MCVQRVLGKHGVVFPEWPRAEGRGLTSSVCRTARAHIRRGKVLTGAPPRGTAGHYGLGVSEDAALPYLKENPAACLQVAGVSLPAGRRCQGACLQVAGVRGAKNPVAEQLSLLVFTNLHIFALGTYGQKTQLHFSAQFFYTLTICFYTILDCQDCT